jgi:biotin carboxyl carrier protein
MRYRYQVRDQAYDIILERQAGGYHVTVAGQTYELEILSAQPGEISLRFEGQPVTLYWAGDEALKWISLNGCTYRLEKPAPRHTRQAREASGEDIIRAPMPAQVRGVEVAPGDSVERGDTLVLLEAMKMEIRIRAPRKSRIASVRVFAGQTVERDEVLVEIERET